MLREMKDPYPKEDHWKSLCTVPETTIRDQRRDCNQCYCKSIQEATKYQTMHK
jgi:hypothetical protein